MVTQKRRKLWVLMTPRRRIRRLWLSNEARSDMMGVNRINMSKDLFQIVFID